MESGPETDWRRLVHELLTAEWQDHVDGLARRETNREARFFESHGTEDLRARRRTQYDSFLGRAKPPEPPETCVAVEESTERAVVEVPMGLGAPPHFKRRILLVRREDAWLVHDVYWPCTCTMLSKRRGDACAETGVGRCAFCNGTGRVKWPRTEKLLGLIPRTVAREDPCSFCGGTGKCKRCSGSGTPGWRSALDPALRDDGQGPPEPGPPGT